MNNLYTKYDLADKLRFTENAVNNYLQQFDKKRYTAKVINDVGVKGLVNGLGTRTK